MHGDCFQRCGLHRIGGGVAVPTQGGCVFKSGGLKLNYLRIYRHVGMQFVPTSVVVQ